MTHNPLFVKDSDGSITSYKKLPEDQKNLWFPKITYVPENYDVEVQLDINSHLQGIDQAIAESGGGGGGGGASELDDLTDVEITSPVDKHILQFDGSLWKNVALVVTWTEITGKPTTFAPSSHTHGWTEITGKPTTFAPSSHTHGWTEIAGKPSTFPPDSHTHSASEITSGTFADARISSTSVTQHQSSLSIGWGQLTSVPSTFAPSTHIHDGTEVSYDNTTSGLTATDVQAAIDELATTSGGSSWYSRDQSMFDNWTGGNLTTVTWSNTNKTAENTSGGNAHQFYSLVPFGGDGGKYYFEVVADTVNGNLGIGVTSRATAMLNRTTSGIYVGSISDSFAYWHNGTTYNNNSATYGFSTFANGDVISVAVDSAAGKIWWAKNGTWEASGDPAGGTGAQYTSTAYLARQLHVHVSPYALNAKATLRGLSSEFGYTPPSGFIAPFD